MKKTDNQKEQVFDWFGIINHPKKENATKADFGAFNEILNKLYSHNFLYATIVHDKDIQEDGTFKTIHQHIFLNTRDHTYTKEELLSKLSQDLAIPQECISLGPAGNLYSVIRYLTHREQKWKAQYDAKDIFTNSWEEIEPYYLTDMEVLEQATTQKEIVNLRNLKFLKDYKVLWGDFRKETKEALRNTRLLQLYRHYFELLQLALDNEGDNELIRKQVENLEEEILMLDMELNTTKKVR